MDSDQGIADGLRTPGLKAKLEEIEARLTQVDQDLEAPKSSPVRFHPNLADLYRQKVIELAATLSDPDIRTRALETIRSLIRSVTVSVGADGINLELEGAITMMIDVS